MKKVLDFLGHLRKHNDRDWFVEHKSEYLAAKEEFEAFAEELINGIAAFDPTTRGLTVKDCTYRIYRDTRFSNNKDPYKAHMGAYVCPFGKKSGYAGYYFHLEPESEGAGGSFITSGLYMPEPNVLKSVRYEILENGEAFEAAIKKTKGFELGRDNMLKKLPAGFKPGSPYDEYLKFKDINLTKALDKAYLTSPGLAQRVVTDLKKTYDFTAQLNRAVQYAFDENTDD